MAYRAGTNTGSDLDPFLHPLDAILADIAIAVQLPPGLHAKACDRYEAVRTFAEREGSPLNGLIRWFYRIPAATAADTVLAVSGRA